MVRVVRGERRHSVTSCEKFFLLVYKGFIFSPSPFLFLSPESVGHKLNQKRVNAVSRQLEPFFIVL